MNYLTKYGFWGVIKYSAYLMYTKFFFKGSRLIRFPFDIRNKKNIDLGSGFTCGYGCRIESEGGTIQFGKNCQINDYVHISSFRRVVIGDNFLCASKVYITDLNHGIYSGLNCSFPTSPVAKRELSGKPVTIGNNVWVGENVVILPGVKIGDNAIVGASSVVTKDIDGNSIAVGNPAKIIKKWNDITNVWEAVI